MLFLAHFTLNGQVPKGQFYSIMHAMANFCQVDGDQASGYNKFGYSLGFQVGQGIGNGWVYETGFSYSVRGSRRPIDPDNPALQSFNLDYRMIDIPVKLMKYYKKFTLGGGIITTYTLRAKDLDNYILNVQNDTKKVNMLGFLSACYNVGSNTRLNLEYQYSINSIRISNNSGNPFFPTGVYHNVISLGVDYLLSGNSK